MMIFYCVLEVVAFFFAFGPLHFAFTIVQFHHLYLFFLKFSVAYVWYHNSIYFAEVVFSQLQCKLKHAHLGTKTMTVRAIFIDTYIYTTISMRHVCVGLSLAR